MNMRGQAKQMKAINPRGEDYGPEYNQCTLALTAPKVAVPAGQGAKASMRNGPYGGKVKA